MALIELKLDRPAWKRVEQTSDATEEGPVESETEIEIEAEDEDFDTQGGTFSMRRLLVMATVAVVGVMAVRRIRDRMRGDTEKETSIDVESPATAAKK